MSIKRFSLLPFVFFLLVVTTVKAQNDGGYKLPPKDIADMLLAKPTPGVNVDDKGEWMLFTEANSYPSVEELARPELKIAGLRINPNNFAPSRQNFINNIFLRNIASGKDLKITGLPTPLFAGNISWSPNDKKIAFTQTTTSLVDLYVIDVATQKATKDKVVYTVEASKDLANWTTVVVTELNAADSAPVQATLALPTLGADWEWHSFRTQNGVVLNNIDMIRLSVAAE